MKRFLLSRITPLAIGLVPLALHAEPQWIWSSTQAKPNEKQTFQRTFSIAGDVKSATLALSCDNGSTAFINGKTAAENADWSSPVKNDVTKLLKPGQNELRIDGRNIDGVAALVAILTIQTADGKKEVIETGPDWKVAVAGTSEFKPAVAIAKYGAAPWGDVFKDGGKKVAAGVAPNPAEINVPEGFKVELLYTVPKEVQGSWVSMTVDPKGRLITGDQYGGLYLITPPPIGSSEETKVEPINIPIGGAHGLLYAFNSLYVMVNEKAETGLWRLRDTDGNDHFAAPELLRKIPGGGEHGPHNVVLGPDGKSLYFAAGNHTKLPDHMEKSRAVAINEDHLLPRMWDANGHAKGILAPGGYTARTDPDGKTVELFSAGFRNHYDIAFDPNGELFTYDSDMEWDMGSPWYLPTRINHSVDGGDYGWRSGAGRWPAYYADSLPAVVDIGPGSPTGVVFGTGAKFPAKYQRAFFGCDWTYGTMFAIHLTPDGASFRGVKEEFVSGKALPLTDVIIHPKDGAMYFTVGGRRTQSALYRVTYVGKEATTPAPRIEPTKEAGLRHELEKLHEEGTGPEAIDKAWPSLGNADRFIRFAARAAIERQPAAKWADRALSEKNPQAAIEALIALARVGDKSMQGRLIEALGQLDFAKLPADLRLPLLRAWELAFTRMGKPEPAVCAKVVAKLDPLFPSNDNFVNRELVSLLVYLDSPTVVAKTVPLLSTSRDDYQEIASEALLARNSGYASAVSETSTSRPNRQQIAYVYALRNAKVGWNPELKKSFFGWFPTTRGWKGGNSFS
ncbi:MAG: Cytochrome c, partial [Chthoniobacteraceae bacterium]|nr:Cytochrome c [Chthoniobacteraceae bacterium]